LSGYDVFDDPYCYNDTFVLKNKARLRDPKSLEDFELEMSTLRAEEALPAGNFTPSHYRKVHRHLFQDVYSWAGKYRTVRTGKSGNWFCYPEYIEAEMNKLFTRLKGAPFIGGATAEEFVTAAAEFLAELNAIHPFREGNGRAQLSFLYLLVQRAGHNLRLDKIDQETFLPAMIASFSGNTDPLKEELRKLLC
jgi:cell filamentation protein